MLVLPSKTAPAAHRRATTVASWAGTKVARPVVPPVVMSPAVSSELKYPRIVYTDLDGLRLLARFGECQVMTHPVAKRLFIS
jgi:hypothetical protein